MVDIEINGEMIEAEEGAMVIEAADAAGITIPRFCYHKKLSIAANCRMCLVEVEKVGKPVPACATPVTGGMKVYTRSPKAIAAQRSVMEFLLINHPLDCPICDQGGECDLQEMAMGFGNDISRYNEGKRVIRDRNIGPLISTDMTRCIHCTRCVRFGQEIAGMMELGAPGRGEHMRITTYLEDAVESELSGNVIDLCPVGALTSKPYRYTARPWELDVHNSVSPHDCVGANLRVDTRASRVMRVGPRENEEVNETWLADRDRFSYTALYDNDRLKTPLIKKDGQWQEADWDTALTFAADGLKRIIARDGATNLGALAADWSTTEELYLLQKLMRKLGSSNIDHRVRQQDFSDQDAMPSFPWLGQSIASLSSLDAALLVGSNVRHEQPLLGQRLRQAALKGARISFINPMDYDFHFPVEETLVDAPAAMLGQLAAVVSAAAEQQGVTVEGLDPLVSVDIDDRHQAIARSLIEAKNGTVLMGNISAYHPAAGALRQLGAQLAELADVRFGYLAEGGNSAGAWLAGTLPHRGVAGSEVGAGKDWKAMFESGLAGYVLLGLEPERDCIDPVLATRALEATEFVVALSAYDSPAMRQYADAILPIALYPETSGTYVNGEGRWQSFTGCANPPGEARPAWKLLRVFGNLLDIEGFGYMGSDEVFAEVQGACSDLRPDNGRAWQAPTPGPAPTGIVRITDFPIYAVDPMVRRSAPLQDTALAAPVAVHACADTLADADLSGAGRLRVRCGDSDIELPVVADERVPRGSIYIASGGYEPLGGAFASIELTRA
ncbi:NADH-quinone oxidoreductase subunit NuoG [Thiohalomonas denitrificans]|uniref:NADH-quinone oxidoreductase n=1 Tax=Thiohalomonas denitrificans TaxID=415747 RepID=A0A1G5PK73_9GAMM|nr:NADH-quinone oxidoreductase subunit NuoG [Thiohalomonas denitrificans]SCZ49449.1 NADH dehydrogenase subunit G [Thiohalomonas denitrificans]